VTYLNMHQQQQAYATLLEAKRLYDRQESIHAFPRIGAFIQYNLGAVMFARAEFDRAETELERALELGGQYLALRPMAKMLLSRVAAQRGDWKKATEELKEALKYQDNPDWRVDLAEMQRRGGQIPAARATLQQTLRTYPGNQRATALLAQINKPAPPPAPAPAAPVEP
jgi:tetratricopeptide (TPR) repeat protein